MSEPQLILPLLDGFAMGEPISDHNGVRCCPAMKNDSDERYIVKIISIPATQQRLDALLLTGAYPDAQSAKVYFQQQADEIINECQILKQLCAQEGFLSFQGYQITEMENGETGYDVYLLADYQRTLLRHFERKPMTQLGAVNLGLDICSALSVCRRSGYLYTDLKPSNIYVINENEYKIGDLGFVRLDSLKYASLPDKYRSQYTAPEISDAFSSLNTTIDIFALGLIMYQAYNGGELPFSGDSAPAEKLPPPQYADYEMSEIILKACDPDPAQRWQDPVEMGQALVGYMQRNGANDTPIVPPMIPLFEQSSEIESESQEDNNEEIQVEEATETPTEEKTIQLEELDPIEQIVQEFSENSETEQAVVYLEDEDGNLCFLDDETTQEVNGDEIEYEEVSEEVSQMMLQVDQIAEHVVPEPVIVPEEVIVTVPDNNPETESSEIETGNEENVEGTLTDSEESTIDSSAEGSTDQEATSAADVDGKDSAESEVSKGDEDAYCDEEPEPPHKKKILRNIIIALIALAVIASAVLYYELIYIQTIDKMELQANEDTLRVTITSDIDDKMLSVTCADAYGNKSVASVTNGVVEFKELLPGTEYRITVSIDGFHKLEGQYEKTYYSPSPTTIVQLKAETGSEDGTAVVSFIVDGPDSQEWIVHYKTNGEPENAVTITEKKANLTNLTVGKEYTISVSPVTQLYMSGEQTVLFTATNVIKAENLAIISCKDNMLTAVWSAPSDVQVKEWTVTCYNDSGYREVVKTQENTYTFEGIDNTQNYVVEVKAAGQTAYQYTSVAENSITLEPMTVEVNERGQIHLKWEASAEIPEGGWQITYTIANTDLSGSVTCQDNEWIIKDAIPEQTYEISISAVNGAPVVCAPISVTTDAPVQFSCSYGGPEITAANITFSMCRTPNKANWTKKDLTKNSYTTEFALGEKASFLIKANKLYGISSDELTALYVVYDSEGAPICVSHEEFTWATLWDYYSGELNISALPTTAGEYTMVVYFNGDLAVEQAFSITE